MYRILYVDDEQGLLDIAKIFLEQDPNFSVDTTPSPMDVLNQLSYVHYDAIISDYQMPRMDGIELLKKVRSSYGGIPFILFTGRGREEVVIEAINSGADFYLQKGGDPQSQFTELAHKVRQAVNRRRAEIALIDSEQRLKDIIDFLPDATFAIDITGKVIAWNRAMEEMTGTPAPNVFGKDNYEHAVAFYGERRPMLIDLVTRQDAAFENNHYLYTRHSNTILTAETILKKKGKKPVHLWGKATILYNQQGERIGAIESVRDITEQKEAEMELRASSEQIAAAEEELKAQYDELKNNQDTIRNNEYFLRNVFSSIQDGISILDENLTVLDVNKTMEEWYKHELPLTGRKCYEVYHGRTERCEVCPSIKTLNSGKPAIETVPLVDEGVIKGWLELYSFPFIDADTGKMKGVIEYVHNISDRRQKEDELQKQQQQLSDITEMIPGLVFQFYARPDGTMGLYYISNRGRSFWGYSGNINDFFRWFTEHIDPLDRGEFLRSIDEAVREEKPWNFEGRFNKDSGEQVWIQGMSRPFRRGSELLFNGIIFDITDQKLAGIAVQESEQKYRTVVETAEEGIWILDKDFLTVFSNKKLQEIFGYTQEGMQGRPIWDFLLPEEVDSMKQTLLERQTGIASRYERRWVRKDGTIIWCLTSGTPLFHTSGAFIGSFGMFTDITKRKEMEEALRQSEEKYRSIIDNVQDVIYRSDRAGNLIMVSRSFADKFGYESPDECIGKNIAEQFWMYPERRQEFLSELEKKGSVNGYEIVLKKKDGTPFITSSSSHFYYDHDGSVAGVEGILHDITEMREAQDQIHLQARELRTAKEAYQRANEKLNLLSNITRHDITNKLTTLKGFLEISKKFSKDPDHITELIEKEMQIVDTIEHQIGFTRYYQNMGLTAPVWHNINHVARKAAASLPSRGITLAADRIDVEVFADPLFEKVFYNLIDNTLRYGGDGLTRITISSRENDTGLILIYEDDGAGIRDEDRQHLFERGYGRNTGLGLFLVREILGITGIGIQENGLTGKGVRFEMNVPREAFRFTKTE